MKKNYIIILLLFFAISVFTDYSRDLELARRYVALNKFEEAKALLEPLYLERPSDVAVKMLLKQIYRTLKDSESLLKIIESDLAQSPNDARLWVEAGELYLSLGNITKAKSAFDSAMKIAPRDESLMLTVFNAYLAWGYADEGIALLLKARKDSGNPSAYAMEIASMYEIRGDWNSAADEYALYLKQFPDRFPEVERRMNEISADTSQLAGLEKAVQKLTDKGIEGDRVLRLLARLQARQGKYLQAMQSLITAETRRGEKGSLVLSFMREAQSAGAHDAVILGGNYLMDAEQRVKEEANLIKVISLKTTGKTQEALSILKNLKDSKNISISTEALIIEGSIYLENIKDYEKSAELFSKAISQYPRYPNIGSAYRGLTEVEIKRGNLEKARDILVQRRTIAPDDVWAFFTLGEIEFYRGAVDTAGAIFRAVAISFPKSPEANDAVEYLALMADASESEKLPRISTAMRLKRQGLIKESLDSIDVLVKELKGQSWLDLLLWQRANIRLEMGNIEGAKADLVSISSDYRDGYHAPQALEKLGDIAISVGDFSAGHNFYNRILIEFPNSVNSERVRAKIRAMPGNI